MSGNQIRIGTRGSELALWQAHWVEREILKSDPDAKLTINVIKTQGDRILDVPLAQIGEKALFTREIENALLTKEIDLAVHSLKDLPTELPAGLTLGAIPIREDMRDVFLPHPSNPEKTLLKQPHGARIATGSLRRKSQLLALRPDFVVVDIRGNLNTRIKKLDESDWSGMILAHAGIARLGWLERIGEIIDPMTILPAVGQGALGIEIRDDDKIMQKLLMPLHHDETAIATRAERALLRTLEGGCQIPIGTYGRVETSGKEKILMLDAIVGSIDGKTVVRGSSSGSVDAPEDIGRTLAQRLLAEGASAILQNIRFGTSPQSRVEI